MCVQYRGGYHENRGDILSTVGDILSTVGCSVPWGDIMSTVGGYLEYCGGISRCTWGYHEYRGGCLVPWGIQSFEILVPWGIS